VSSTWAIYILLQNPGQLAKLIRELDAAFPDASTINYRVAAQLKYLDAVIYESLRLFPVGAGTNPRVTPPGGRVISGCFMPEGTTVGVPLYAYHRSPLIWRNSEEFLPDRWLTPEGPRMRKRLLTFLIGPRACLGRGLAVMEMTLILASLFRNFHVQAVPKQVIEPAFYITLQPKCQSFLVTVTPRA